MHYSVSLSGKSGVFDFHRTTEGPVHGELLICGRFLHFAINERVGIAEGVFVDQNQTPRSFVTRRLKSTPRNRRHNVFTDTTFSNIQTMSLWLAGS